MQVGQSLLHYRLIERIGEGGMGVVWKALDTTLDRKVAIKFLPAGFAGDPERLARFTREAKVLASLNHPSIAGIYGLHEVPSPGAGQDALRFIAMEFVHGEDLAVRLRRGPLSIESAVAIAMTVADALSTAHGNGVVHRDLKPANVMLTAADAPKVLDFGLAKAIGPDGARSGGEPANPALSPTVTSLGTVPGLILGTAAYMSPEQARGRPVDRRADIWALGAMLYEMLCARPPFAGETVSDTLASVLKSEPDWDALPAATPPAVRRLLRRCLEKNPKDRLHDAADVRIELAHAFDEGDRATVAATGLAAARSRWAVAAIVTPALVAGALVGLLAGTRLLDKGEKATAPKPLTMRRLTELPGPEKHPHLSPDGRQLIYSSSAAGNADVYLLRVGGDRAVNLTAGSPADDSQEKFSPDGEKIVFRSERDGGGLFTMGATGESVRRVTDFGMDPCWSPDGRRLAFGTEAVDDPYSRQSLSTLWTVELATGQKKQLTTTGDAVQPAWSPDGRHIAYWANTGGQRDIWIIAADGGTPVAVTQDRFTDWSPVWSPDGRWLYFASDRGGSMNLWRLPCGADGAPKGDAQPLTTGTQSMGWAAFSEDGRRMVAMAYDRTNDVSFYELARLRRGETAPLRRLKLQSSVWCTLSPDAEWIACSTRGAHEDLVLLRSDGSEMRRLTDDEHKDRGASWAPDGQALAFFSTRSGAWNYWWIRTDGSEPRQITAFSDFNGGSNLSPDGKQVALNADYRGLVVVDVNVSKPVDWNSVHALPMPEGYPAAMFGPTAWSPDGRLLAGFETGASGRAAGYAIYDLREKSLRRLALTSGNQAYIAGWLPDSRNLVLRGPAGVAIYDTATGTPRTILAESTVGSLSLARDGEVLMVQHELLDSEIWLLDFE